MLPVASFLQSPLALNPYFSLSGYVQGVIMSLTDSEGVIKSDEHGELPFDIKENFSDVEFTTEDINEEVEFTVVMVRFLFGLAAKKLVHKMSTRYNSEGKNEITYNNIIVFFPVWFIQ